MLEMVLGGVVSTSLSSIWHNPQSPMLSSMAVGTFGLKIGCVGHSGADMSHALAVAYVSGFPSDPYKHSQKLL